MSILSKLFGGSGGNQTAEPVEYKDFRIYPDPQPAGGQFRLAARIEKDIGGETRTHQLIRADTLESRETAITVATDKAKQVIDEQGDSLFR